MWDVIESRDSLLLISFLNFYSVLFQSVNALALTDILSWNLVNTGICLIEITLWHIDRENRLMSSSFWDI